MNNNPIGVFDSGVGGLTVLKYLQKVLPNESYLYVADQLNVPYGTKTDEELISYITKIINFFIKNQVKAIVIACNTASLFCDVVKELTDIPVFNVIIPAFKMAMATSNNKHIGIMATNLTIKKARYQSLIKENGGISCGVGCSEFVEFIESADTSSKKLQDVVHKKALSIDKSVDTLILGCTHFGLISNLIKKELPNVVLVDSSKAVSFDVESYLNGNNLQANYLHADTNSSVKYYTTGNASYSKIVCQKIFNENIPFEHIKL